MKITSNLSQHPTQAITATCPACGLLCDDIVLGAELPITVKHGCDKGITFFQQVYSQATPSLAGKSVDLTSAIKAAADILQKSNQPLFAGLGTEVKGMRALIRLAEKAGAALDHMHAESTMRNTLTLQNSGYQTTSLTEVKNRADLILAIGTDIVTSHPRFFEKLVWNKENLFNKPMPEVIYLGVSSDNAQAGIAPNGAKPLTVPAAIENLPEIINALNALVINKKLHVEHIAGVSIASLNIILDKIKSAKYAVVVWSTSSLKFAHAELTVQSITRLIAKLNETSRVAGLPLNSGDGDTSINNTSTWLSGYPTRNRFHNGQIEYDAYHFSSNQQLKSCDALLWISTFNANLPLQTGAPTIVVGHPNMQFDVAPDVFIPVSIPGLDQAGTMFRMDSSVVLPLKKVRNTDLPSLSEVIHQIEGLLT